MSFKCDECAKSFTCKRYLTKHVARIHNNQNEEKVLASEAQLKCRMCGMFFPRVSHLRRHQMTHLNVREYECDQCEKTFVQKSHLTRHMMRAHEDNYKEKLMKQQGVKRVDDISLPFFACPKCGILFKTNYELDIHRERMHSAARCGRCRQIVVDDMRKHQMICRQEKNMCAMCGASFKRPAELRSHENACLKRATFKCIPCNEFFKQRVQLDRHIKKLHFREEKCDQCDFIFDSPVHRAQHYKTSHAKLRCGYCGKEDPEFDHVPMKHWMRLKRPINLMNKKKAPEREMQLKQDLSEDAIQENFVGQDYLASLTEFNVKNEPKENNIIEEDEKMLTFEINPSDKAATFTFKGKLPLELVQIFPILDETAIVLLDSFRESKTKLTVQVPVMVPRNLDASKWLNQVIVVE